MTRRGTLPVLSCHIAGIGVLSGVLICSRLQIGLCVSGNFFIPKIGHSLRGSLLVNVRGIRDQFDPIFWVTLTYYYEPNTLVKLGSPLRQADRYVAFHLYSVHLIINGKLYQLVDIFTHYSKTCLQETPQYLRESVPIWQVSLHHRFLNMEQIGHGFKKVSSDHRLSLVAVSLEDRFYRNMCSSIGC